MSKRYRGSRDTSLAEGIAALVLMMAFGIQWFMSRLTLEWKTFLAYSIPFTGFMFLMFLGLFAWHRRQEAKARALQEQKEAQTRAHQLQLEAVQEAQQRQKEQDLQFLRTSEVSAIKQMSAMELEEYVAELFRRMGYQASLTPTIGDYGVDVRLVSPQGEKELVQCKQWSRHNNSLVGEPEVRDLYGTMTAENAVRGYVVAPYGFTQQAMKWAAGKPVILVDANWLYLKASEVNFGAGEVLVSQVKQASADPQPNNPPICPRCGIPMVLRVASRGAHIGESFYGCSNYPRCDEKVFFEQRSG